MSCGKGLTTGFSDALGRKLNRRRKLLFLNWTHNAIAWYGVIGFPKGFNFPRDAHMLAFVKFSLLTLGVEAKGSTCPGKLMSGQLVSSHSAKDRISFFLPGRLTKVSPFGKGQGTLLVEARTMGTGWLDASQ